MSSGQPTGTQNGSTIASTDSAATETNTNEQVAQAMAAESAAAATWVREHLGKLPRSVKVSRVPVDIVQLFATAGVDYTTVMRDSMASVNGLSIDTAYDLFDNDQFSYVAAVNRRMSRVLQLPAGSTVDASYVYRKPHLKQRQMVKIVSDLQTNARGKEYYTIHVGYLDAERPLDEPAWLDQDVAAKQWGEMRLYVEHTASGTALWRWHNGKRQAVGLGDSSIVANRAQDCLTSEFFTRLQEIGASSPELQADEIRREHNGQLVFWQAQHLAAQARAAISAAN